MKIECIKCINYSYIEIIDDNGSKYWLSSDKFFNIIEEQRNDIGSNSHYPFIYATEALKNFYDKYPECCI